MAGGTGGLGSGEQLTSGGTGGLGTGGSSSGGTGGDTNPESPPLLLSQAGLYEADMVTLAAGVRPFTPQYQLWTDGAAKRRWIWLPEGSQIDTSDMDYWQYPVGTRVYKEFSRDGVRIETRLLQRQPNGSWWRIAYHWRADQTEADAVPDGVTNASGTDHDIPSQEDCGTCHLRMPDKVIGFSAIQLADDTPEDDTAWTLARLEAEGRFTHAPPALQIPGDDTARAALGYLHANCGHCHHPLSSVTSRVAISLWLSALSLGEVEATTTYSTTVGREVDGLEDGPPDVSLIIDPGSPPTSSLFVRIDSRGEEYSMPGLGTELIDPDGRQTLWDWILSLGENGSR